LGALVIPWSLERVRLKLLSEAELFAVLVVSNNGEDHKWESVSSDLDKEGQMH